MFRVREATPNDVAAVKLLDKNTIWEQMEEEERKFIRDFDRFHDDFWQKMTGGKGTAFYVAENPAGKVVGMVWLRVSERISGLKWGWIHDLTVDEGFRREECGGPGGH